MTVPAVEAAAVDRILELLDELERALAEVRQLACAMKERDE